jgi:exosortase/archaeosortase family protein
MKGPKYLQAFAIGIVIYLGLGGVATCLPSVVELFGQPAGALASLLIGVPFHHGVIDHPTLPVEVVRACSGWDLFRLMAALLSGRVVAHPSSWRHALPFALLSLPVAATVTEVVNAGRLAAVVASGLYIVPHLPPVTVHSFHTALGIAFFLPALLLTWSLWDRRASHE